jgi:hypothetical protein
MNALQLRAFRFETPGPALQNNENRNSKPETREVSGENRNWGLESRERSRRIWTMVIVGLGTLLVLHAGSTAAIARAQEPDRRPDLDRNYDNPNVVTLPAGAVIPVRIADEVNSNKDKKGDLYTGTVDPSVLVHDHVVIPRGTEAHIRLVEDKKGGHLHGKAKVRLELVSLIMNGERLGVETDQPSKHEGSTHAKASAEAKKGPGGAAGTVTTGNPGDLAAPVIAVFAAAKVDVKPGSRISFTLEEPFAFQPPPVQGSQNQ